MKRYLSYESRPAKDQQKESRALNGKVIRVKELNIGEGIPKICAGIAAAEFDLVLAQHQALLEEPADLLEWRLDYLLAGQYGDIDQINATLAEMAAVDPRPVILTLRTENEGGMAKVSSREYRELIRSYATQSDAAIIDIEAFDKENGPDREIIAFLASLAHENGKTVILSNHDFTMTPPRREIVQRLKAMADMGADIPKAAYMPQTEDDVHTLLAAAMDASEILPVPFIALSMGELGQPSRVCGGSFGSCITFGASPIMETAPGQIGIRALRDHLQQYYQEDQRGSND